MNNDILFYAFRYALGRSTYAVQDVVTEIVGSWSLVPRYTQLQIRSEIKSAIRIGQAGMLMDISEWEKVLELETSHDVESVDAQIELANELKSTIS
jgi:hypothetical protein